jgi:hypothetical protein
MLDPTRWARPRPRLRERDELSRSGSAPLAPGGISETEILLAYGSVRFASKVGQLAGNHFLTIVEGAEKLPELGRLILWQGAQPIEFTPL